MTIKLPAETLIKIFEQCTVTYQQKKEEPDYVTLRSCSLVNRQWCALATPMIWKEPLMTLQVRNSTVHMPITTYIMCLSDEAKDILSKCGIIITPTLKRRPTFNYASFLQNLDYVILFNAVEKWIEKCNKDEQSFIPIYQVYQLIEQLCRMFIKNCDNLRQLRLKKSSQVRCLSDSLLQLHLFPGAETSLSMLNKFSFDGCMQSEVLSKASEISRNIQHLHIDCVCSDSKELAKLIQVQQKPLLSLSIDITTFKFIPNIENALRDKVKSLTSLTINRMSSLNIYSNCSNLEKLAISHGECFSERLMENFVNSKFPKLRELQLQLDYPFLYQISTLIKNTFENLTTIYLYWIFPKDTNNLSLLITTIITHCPNLTEYLGSYPNEIIQYLPLFFKKCPKLEYFYIHDDDSDFCNISNVMRSISNVIPKNLKMMWLSESWICNIESLTVFLEGCEKRLSEPLLFFICNRTNQHDEIIRKYIVKNVLAND